MFVRFNPDSFMVDGETVYGLRRADRRRLLAEYVKQTDLRNAPPLQIVYMYYDAVSRTDGRLVPTVSTTAEYDNHLSATVSWLAPGRPSIMSGSAARLQHRPGC